MEGVEVGVGGLEVEGIGGSEAIGEFREGEAVTEKRKFDVGVIQRREKIEDGVDFFRRA